MSPLQQITLSNKSIILKPKTIDAGKSCVNVKTDQNWVLKYMCVRFCCNKYLNWCKK